MKINTFYIDRGHAEAEHGFCNVSALNACVPRVPAMRKEISPWWEEVSPWRDDGGSPNCTAEVTVATNYDQSPEEYDGDYLRTLVRLENLGGMDFNVRTTNDDTGDHEAVELVVSGDSQTEVLIDALRFAADSLEEIIKSNQAALLGESNEIGATDVAV